MIIRNCLFQILQCPDLYHKLGPTQEKVNRLASLPLAAPPNSLELSNNYLSKHGGAKDRVLAAGILSGLGNPGSGPTWPVNMSNDWRSGQTSRE